MGAVWVLCSLVVQPVVASFTVTFDALSLPGPDTFYNGSDLNGGFTSQGVHFNNNFNTNFGSWSGFAYSNVDDPTTPGFGNQYAAFSGTDRSGTGNYAVGFGGAADMLITMPSETMVEGFYAVNTTFAALAIRDGDAFANAFEQGDWFRLTVTGLDGGGAAVGSVDFDLANFESLDPNEHFIREDWTWVDLTSLGSSVQTLTVALDSTDQGAFGMNTPAYFAMDDLVVVPEPATGLLVVFGLLACLGCRRRPIYP